jgi:hypothetical protein
MGKYQGITTGKAVGGVVVVCLFKILSRYPQRTKINNPVSRIRDHQRSAAFIISGVLYYNNLLHV